MHFHPSRTGRPVAEPAPVDPTSIRGGAGRPASEHPPRHRRGPRRRASRSAARLLAALALLGLTCPPVIAATLSASPSASSDGVYQLSWTHDGPVVLEEAQRDDFADAQRIYEGHDRRTTLSGKPDGTYYYRLRTATPGEADPSAGRVRVDVQHHPLSRAVGFFLVGGVVFVATVFLVLRGGRDGGTLHG